MKNIDSIFNLNNYNRVVIIRHTQPDADALSSAYGLAQIIGENSDTEVVVANPDKAKSYLFERSFNLSDISFTIDSNITIDREDLVIVVDIANTERIAVSSDIYSGKSVILIDHHPLDSTDIRPNIDLSNRESGSAAEIIATLCKGNISVKAAQLLLPGIITDTGGFKYGANPQKSKEIAYELAGLIYPSFPSAYISETMSIIFTPSKEEAELQAYIASYIVYHKEVAVAIITKDIVDDIQNIFGSEYASFDVLAKMAFVVVRKAKAKLRRYTKAAYAIADPNGGFKISLRDSGRGICNPIALKYNGGGHTSAASCSVDSMDKVHTVFNDFINY